jgi:NitT/TauT family transport system substrate-binding protein
VRIPILLALALAAGGCRDARKPAGAAPLRLGFFPNITHAQALVGNQERAFQKALSPVPLEVKMFNAGPSAMEAILAGAVDVTYVGNAPAIAAHVRSGGEVLVIAGAASGGAGLVARTVTNAQELRGKRVAIPQIGNSQDVALRHWLQSQGMVTRERGGDVTVTPLANADILALFIRGELDAAWVPEPWTSRLIAEGGGRLLIDERDLWEGHRFPSTVLVASRKALVERRAAVRSILKAHLELTRRAHASGHGFMKATNTAFGALTHHPLPPTVLEAAFARLELTTDPMPGHLAEAARRAHALGYLPSADVSRLVDTSLLRELTTDEPGF